LNKKVWAISILLLFLITPSIIHATKSECYNGLLTIEVKAPNEVKPEEEFQISFKIYSISSNVNITVLRVEFWAIGNYKEETLLKGFSLGKGGTVVKNTTFMLAPAPPYPNIVTCDIWLECSQEGDLKTQFFHSRFTLSWCTPSTYEELEQAIHIQENDISKYQSTVQLFEITTAILAIITVSLAATMVYFAFERRKKGKQLLS
jgi:hypothetical protein